MGTRVNLWSLTMASGPSAGVVVQRHEVVGTAPVLIRGIHLWTGISAFHGVPCACEWRLNSRVTPECFRGIP